jgi:hypothetical protein
VSRAGGRSSWAVRLPEVPWWAYDALLVTLGALAIAASFALSPGDDPRWVYLPTGRRFGDTCAMLEATGLPCPQCGMTRSWVHAVRGRWIASFLYSPGGFGLLAWLLVAAGLAAVRLVRRDPFAIALPWRVPLLYGAFWMVGLYLLPWLLRLAGVNPLP